MAPMVSEEEDSTGCERALEQAERGRGRVEPNPLVGAVLVKDEQLARQLVITSGSVGRMRRSSRSSEQEAKRRGPHFMSRSSRAAISAKPPRAPRPFLRPASGGWSRPCAIRFPR